MLLHEENKLANCDIAGMFTEKNLSEDRIPSTLDALVLHLRRALKIFP